MVNPQARSRFADYLNGRAGNFTTFLFQALYAADRENFARLQVAFPDEAACVAEYRGYPKTGAKA